MFEPIKPAPPVIRQITALLLADLRREQFASVGRGGRTITDTAGRGGRLQRPRSPPSCSRSSGCAGDDGRRAMTPLERNQDDLVPHTIGRDRRRRRSRRVISALDEVVGPQQLDQPERRILVKQRHQIDAVDRRHDDRAGVLILHWPRLALEATDGGVLLSATIRRSQAARDRVEAIRHDRDGVDRNSH